ncbi:MAG: 2-dehydropantoate 2-reductase [Myxococcota bacterium]
MAARTITGRHLTLGPEALITDTPEALADVDLCLVTVKSGDTQAAAHTLAPLLPPGTPVVSFQNGLRNAAVLRDGGLPGALAGMVSFNVFRDGDTLVQATSGPLVVEPSPTHPDRLDTLQRSLTTAGETIHIDPNIEGVQAAKLLLNLNNGICALAGVSIAESLRQRPLRQSFGACIREGLAIYRASGIALAPAGRLSPRLIARLLPLPNAIVLRVAPALIDIDPRARSSTLQDLEAGKATEIDMLNGELVRLARLIHLPCPINSWVVEQIHRLEGMGLPIAHLPPGLVWGAIRARH